MCVGGYLLNIHDPSECRCHRIKNKSKLVEVVLVDIFLKVGENASDGISFLSLPFVEVKARAVPN